METTINFDLDTYKKKSLIFNKIPIEANELDNYKSIIFDKTKKIFEGKNSDLGFIMKIYEDKFKYDLPIASSLPNGLMYSNVSFFADIINILPGCILYDCRIKIINEAGIFASKGNELQISVFPDILDKKNFISQLSIGNLIDIEVIAARDFVYDTRIGITGAIHYPGIVSNIIKTDLTIPTINKKNINITPAPKLIKYSKQKKELKQLTGGINPYNSLSNKILNLRSNNYKYKNSESGGGDNNDNYNESGSGDNESGSDNNESDNCDNNDSDNESGNYNNDNDNESGSDDNDDNDDNESDSDDNKNKNKNKKFRKKGGASKLDRDKLKNEKKKIDSKDEDIMNVYSEVEKQTGYDLKTIEIIKLINIICPNIIVITDKNINLNTNGINKFPDNKEIFIDCESNYNINNHSQIIKLLNKIITNNVTYGIFKYVGIFEDIISLQFICLLCNIYSVSLVVPPTNIKNSYILLTKKIGEFTEEWRKIIKQLNNKIGENKNINLLSMDINTTDKKIDGNFIRDLRLHNIQLNCEITKLQIEEEVIKIRPKINSEIMNSIKEKKMKIMQDFIL